MIVQSGPEGRPRFVMRMSEHTELCGKFGRAFGNDKFEPVDPLEEMIYVISHHDDGWKPLDASPGLDPKTRLPYHLIQTPFERIATTTKRSPDVNTEHHPFCGLMSSMHCYGLYKGRYGLSDTITLNFLADENRAKVESLLDAEEKRQEKLKTQLTEDPATAAWVEDDKLFQNYKQLQLFDTLSLYFNCSDEAERGEQEFPHVPYNAKDDVTVKIEPLGDGRYALTPFPFAEDPVEFTFKGRWIEAVSDGQDLDKLLGDTPVSEQKVTLVSG